MRVEIYIEETINNQLVHAKAVQVMVQEGWEIVTHQLIVNDTTEIYIYSTMLKRDDLKNRVSVASMMEIQKRNTDRIRALERRVDDLLSMLDSDEKTDRFAPVDYIEDPTFIPLSRIDIVMAAIAEDEEAGR